MAETLIGDSRRQRHAISRALAFVLTVLAGTAQAQITVSDGTVLTYAQGAVFDGPTGLTMNGGTVQFADFGTGAGFSSDAYNTTFVRGEVASRYTQVNPHILNLYGPTYIQVAPGSGTRPTDGMYFSAVSSEGSAQLLLRNWGAVTQSGGLSITLRGRTTFDNTASATYSFNGDSGIYATDGQPLFRNSGTLRKTFGTGVGLFETRLEQDGGKVEAWDGQLVLNRGGTHNNTRFFADPQGWNAAGAIDFGGLNTFTGNTLTQTGNFRLISSASVNVASGVWTQDAYFKVLGQVSIAPGAKLLNTGRMETLSGGSLTGVGSVRTMFENASTGTFVGSLAGDEFTENNRLQVINAGSFTVGANDEVRARQFTNTAGVLTVDGVLSNRGGKLRLLGGELRGSGFINGDGFTMGGAGVAVFNPGNSPGTFTVEGEFELLPGGVLNLEIERLPDGRVAYDRVVASSFFLDGQVNLLVGAGVEEADVLGLSLLDCGGACKVGHGSNFSFAFPGRPGSMLSFEQSGLQITSLAPVPEPGATMMLVAGLGLVGVAVRRRRSAARSVAAV